MATLLKMVCPTDGLVIEMPFLDQWAGEMATWPIGSVNDLQQDSSVQCANGHRWAMNIKMTFQRLA